jgi:Tol biopolymer transport system component
MMTSKDFGSFAGTPLGRAVPFVLLVAALPAVLRLTACAGRSPAHAESQEIRLTQDSNSNVTPRYSPDGQWIAYTVRGTGGRKNRVFIVPAQGGPAQPVSSEGENSTVLGWASAGNGLYVSDNEKWVIRRLGLDGKVLGTEPAEPLGKAFDVSPDGREILVTRFSGDNNDLGIAPVTAMDDLEILAPTSQWEVGGCFGPRPGEVTAVARARFQAAACSIAVWSPATRTYTALPLPEARNVDPSWSPDGRYLVYNSDLAGRQDLWLYDSQTGRTIQMTTGPEEAITPDWSPDGNSVAFARRTRTSHIFAGDPRTFQTRQLTEGSARDVVPECSRNGRMVAFARLALPERPGERTPAPALCVVPWAGGEVRRLDLKDLRLSAEGGMSWSPDGREIAFVADDGLGNADIYRIAPDGGAPIRVTVDPGPDLFPSWSPDGRLIACTRPAGGETQVWVVPSNGGLARQVTFNDGLNELAAWSPGSDRLACVSVKDSGGFEILVVPVRQPEQSRAILKSPRANYPAAWSSDGRDVLVNRMDGASWAVWAVSVDDGREVRVGQERREKGSGKSFFVDLTPEGQKYADVVYPGNVLAYADGEEVSQIVALPVAGLIKSSLLARKER